VKAGRFLRPGDDFDARADWADILEPHGWTWNGPGSDSADHWCRPGKASGTSATTNFAGSDLLYVFSSNADPFEQDTAYTKFCAYTLLEHSGDFTAAARALRAQGYGAAGSRRRGRVTAPFARYAGYALRPRPKT
jgi:putative DNA primase/helicase